MQPYSVKLSVVLKKNSDQNRKKINSFQCQLFPIHINSLCHNDCIFMQIFRCSNCVYDSGKLVCSWCFLSITMYYHLSKCAKGQQKSESKKIHWKHHKALGISHIYHYCRCQTIYHTKMKYHAKIPYNLCLLIYLLCAFFFFCIQFLSSLPSFQP